VTVTRFDAAEKADVELYRMQATLALENPPVRVRRLEVILTIEDAVYRGLRREHPDVTPVTARQAATVATHVLVSVMETWVEEGAPDPGPEWDVPVATMRATVAWMLGRPDGAPVPASAPPAESGMPKM
jgi:hypothetical protein